MSRTESQPAWRLLAALACFSFVNYVLRTNISVAAKFVMPELRLTQAGMGQIFAAFMLGYAIFQIPAGLAGDKLGPRPVLAAACLIWGVTTFLTAALPGIVFTSTASAIAALLVVRFVLGAGEAATYPVATRAIASWISPERRAFGNSVLTTGMAVASACTPPLMAWIMVRYGWRVCFYATSVLPFVLAAAWWKWAGAFDRGQGHARAFGEVDHPSWWGLLRNRSISLLSISYFLESYIQYIFLFWFYLYLVDVRHLTIVNSGFLTSLPYVVSMVTMPLAGHSSDWLSATFGRMRGRRLVVITAFCTAAALLVSGAGSTDAYVAVGSISLAVGLVLSTEGPFWSTANDIAGMHAGAAGGIMNTAGNFAGVASSSLVPVIVSRLGWAGVFVSSAVLCLVAGGLWLVIRAAEPTGAKSDMEWNRREDLSW